MQTQIQNKRNWDFNQLAFGKNTSATFISS